MIPARGFVASGSVFLAGVVWGTRLLAVPGLFDDGSGALLAVSIVIGSATAGLGLVLARGRWARRLAFGILAAELLLAAAMELDGWGWAALIATSLSVTLVAGPWLDGFLRQLPPAEPLPMSALALAIGLLFVPGVMGVSAPGGVVAIHWVVAGASLATAWAFSRALRIGLWSARLLLPSLLVAAGVFSSFPGAVLILLVGLALATLAWSRATARAVSPLLPRVDGVAVPPELVPPDLLARAGYDDRGRSIERRR